MSHAGHNTARVYLNKVLRLIGFYFFSSCETDKFQLKILGHGRDACPGHTNFTFPYSEVYVG